MFYYGRPARGADDAPWTMHSRLRREHTLPISYPIETVSILGLGVPVPPTFGPRLRLRTLLRPASARSVGDIMENYRERALARYMTPSSTTTRHCIPVAITANHTIHHHTARPGTPALTCGNTVLIDSGCSVYIPPVGHYARRTWYISHKSTCRLLQQVGLGL